jgi:hypothetical protein
VCITLYLLYSFYCLFLFFDFLFIYICTLFLSPLTCLNRQRCARQQGKKLFHFGNDCTAFPSTIVSMLELSLPLPTFLLLRVGGLSLLNTRAVLSTISLPIPTQFKSGTLSYEAVHTLNTRCHNLILLF